jgi:hypothetical protein
VRSLWEYWQHSQPDLSQHFGRPGWEPAAKALIDNYEHAKDRFRFPTADEVRAVLGKEFREIALMGGGHGFDALWPTFAWRREH